jgi:tryptophanyl-tRNA synthetase
MRIDPWASQQSTDYARLRDEFGIQQFDPDVLPEPSPLMQRGVIFGHRGFDLVAHAIRRGDPWGVLTGLMPSGPMHFGHKLVMDQVTYYQRLGADVTITIADIEAWATRGMSLEKSRTIAIENYVKNYLALGLEPKNAQIYFQSKRAAVKDYGADAAFEINKLDEELPKYLQGNSKLYYRLGHHEAFDHRLVSTTLVYARVDDERLRQLHREYHPRG